MLKQFGSATVLFMAVTASALMAVTPAAAQVSLYHMDFKPADFAVGCPGCAANEGFVPNPAGTNFALPGFGWDESHGVAATVGTAGTTIPPLRGNGGRDGVYFPNVSGAAPEDLSMGNAAFVFVFGAAGQTSSIFTTVALQNADSAPVKFPGGVGIDPNAPANAGLGFSWTQHAENTNGGNPIHVQLAVQTSQAGNPWYLTNAIFDTGTTGVGSQGAYAPQSLIYNPAKENWLNLTVPAATVEAPLPVAIGTQPAANLSGLITGVGFVASFVSGNPSLNINYVDIGIPPVPGDVNGDRIVDLNNDYPVIKSHFGTTVSGTPAQQRLLGDVTGDGVVDLLDFAQWKNNFPFPGGGSGSHDSGSVPEPASAVLMALGLPLAWGMLRLRKRNSARRLA